MELKAGEVPNRLYIVLIALDHNQHYCDDIIVSFCNIEQFF